MTAKDRRSITRSEIHHVSGVSVCLSGSAHFDLAAHILMQCIQDSGEQAEFKWPEDEKSEILGYYAHAVRSTMQIHATDPDDIRANTTSPPP